MSNSKYIINSKVPICPICKAGMKFSKQFFSYLCYECNNIYKIVDFGQTEHEFTTIVSPLKKG